MQGGQQPTRPLGSETPLFGFGIKYSEASRRYGGPLVPRMPCPSACYTSLCSPFSALLWREVSEV